MTTFSKTQSINYDGYTFSTIDDSFVKKVTAFVRFYKTKAGRKDAKGKVITPALNIPTTSVNITLWEAGSYDAIGQWTQDDANQRVAELLK